MLVGGGKVLPQSLLLVSAADKMLPTSLLERHDCVIPTWCLHSSLPTFSLFMFFF